MSDLRIAVLVKQVPDPGLVEISEDGRLMRENVPAMMDPFGKMALMHAISSDANVDAVSMGPMQAKDVLYKAMEFGAERSYLISGKEFAGADTLATAKTLASFLNKNGYDLVFCGMQATDGDTAQVPGELSVFMDANIYSYASSISLDDMTVTQSYEDREIVSRLELPAVVSFIRPPEGCRQIPSMTDFVRASDMEIQIIGAQDCGISILDTGAKGSRTKVKSVSTVMRRRKDTEYIDGSDSNGAAKSILSEVKE